MSAGMAVAAAETLSAGILAWVWHALVFGSLLAGLTWLAIRRLRGRASPALETALWAIVLVKFLVPAGPAWSLSLASACERLTWRAAGGTGDGGEVEAGLATESAAAPDEQGPTVAARVRSMSWMTLLTFAYIAGVVGLAAARIWGYRIFRVGCLALPGADPATSALVRAVCRRLGVRPLPLIRISDEHRAPFVMGFVRPLLVLSRCQLVRPDELETVVVHEVTHLRRGDMLVRTLQCVAGTVLFFWPVVAWVNRRIDRVREHACDEWALRHGKLTASQYASCLLSAVQPARPRRLIYQPACMAGSPSTIERRIDMILTSPTRPTRRPLRALVAIAFLLAWGGFALTGAADDEVGVKTKKAKKTEYLATEKSMRLHAEEVYAHVNEYAAGDLDGNGKVSKEECWAFVTAVVMQRPGAVMKEYPEADGNQDGKLGLVEAYGFVRGDPDLAKGRKKMEHSIQAAIKEGDEERAKQIKADLFAKDMQTYHVILDRRDRFIDAMTEEPSLEEVKAIAEKMAQVDAKRSTKLNADKLQHAVEEIASLEKRIAKLRAKAADLGGEKAAAYEAKAQKLEQKAVEMRAKVASVLEEMIAKLEAAGKTDKAAKLREKLADLEDD